MKIFQIGVNDQVKTAIKFSKHFTHTYTLNLEGTAMQPRSTDNRFFNITVNFLFPDEKVHIFSFEYADPLNADTRTDLLLRDPSDMLRSHNVNLAAQLRTQVICPAI